ncbi:MAG: hypothetical protein IK086_05555, partial [Clostridia bacterium]|nr:hypothetical protein [Clostridia bacterium]
MFLRKTAGNIRKHSKLVTCILLAICISLATFAAIPFATSAYVPEDEVLTNTAIFIGKTNSSIVANTFIPVDISSGDANLYTGEVYFKLTFDCKMMSGSKPIVGVMRVNTDAAAADRSVFAEPSWCNNAADVTVENGVCTAYFKVVFNNRFNANDLGWRSFYITVGNAEHSGSGISEKDYGVSFIMSDAKLYTCDAEHNVTDTTNRLPALNEESVDFGGTYYVRSSGCKEWDCPGGSSAMKWHIDSSAYLVKAITVPQEYNISSDYDAENFVMFAATETTREYYTNDKYEGVYFEKLANSDDKAFGIISSDLNKKFVFIDANHQGEEDSLTVDGYKPTKNKVANVFLPLSIGQYTATSGKPAANKKILLKVTFKAARLEGDGPPVLGRVVGKVGSTSGTSTWAWGLSTINV